MAIAFLLPPDFNGRLGDSIPKFMVPVENADFNLLIHDCYSNFILGGPATGPMENTAPRLIGRKHPREVFSWRDVRESIGGVPASNHC